MYQFLFSQEDTSVLRGLDKQVQTWVKANASNCKIVDDLIMYSDKLMTDPHHHRIFIPSDPDYSTTLQHTMIALSVCIVAEMPHTTHYLRISIGATCIKMLKTGFADALSASDLKRYSQPMVLCSYVYINTRFIP